MYDRNARPSQTDRQTDEYHENIIALINASRAKKRKTYFIYLFIYLSIHIKEHSLPNNTL